MKLFSVGKCHECLRASAQQDVTTRFLEFVSSYFSIGGSFECRTFLQGLLSCEFTSSYLKNYSDWRGTVYCRYVQYNQTSLERNYKFDLLTEHDLGVPIDLINPDTYLIDHNGQYLPLFIWWTIFVLLTHLSYSLSLEIIWSHFVVESSSVIWHCLLSGVCIVSLHGRGGWAAAGRWSCHAYRLQAVCSLLAAFKLLYFVLPRIL